MKFYHICIIFKFCIIFIPFGYGKRILYLDPVGGKSHKIFGMAIVEALAKRGHQVVMVSTSISDKKLKNIKEVTIENFTLNTTLEMFFEQEWLLQRYMLVFKNACLDGLEQQQIQDLKKEKFDIIIMSAFFGHCYLSFVHHFKVPLIYTSPLGLIEPIHSMIGNMDVPSLSGNTHLRKIFPITFATRFATTVINIINTISNYYFLEPQMHSECIKRGLCPPDMPPFSEIHKNVSLLILNSVRTLEIPPRPSMPNIIYAGGAHIKPPKKLPQDLEEWVQGSGREGFIVFSLGSLVDASYLPEKYRKILVKVFGSLKQNVLWKWNEETMPALPNNVKLQKWLPQPDLLGHPKIKLFITHGGLLSSQEAIYNEVPMIGMPVSVDQFSNMESVEMEGCGRIMDWKKLQENVFSNLIMEVLNNKTIIESVKRKSVLMKDRLIPPDEEAAYWVEYVLRHKGAPHMMSPLRMMRWYEVYNMDVWSIIMLITGGILYISWIVIRFILKRLQIRKSTKVKRKQT